MDLLAVAAEALQSGMEAFASSQIEYLRRGERGLKFSAVIGATVFSEDDQNNVMDRIIMRDFSFRQTELAEWTVKHPMRNDTIRQKLPDGRIYEGRVLGEGGLPHYQESDAYGVAWRVHSKRDEPL